MKNKKVQVSLLLDEEVVEWVKNEAAQNGTTFDDVINDRLFSMIVVNELSEEKLGLLMTMLKKHNEDDSVN